MNIGIIAEDESDVAVIKELTSSLLGPYCVGFKHFLGGGSGKLRRKCAIWARILVHKGCAWIAVLHDLDENFEETLRAELEDAIAPAGAEASVVLIPRREIEAWLLYDSSAIAVAFKETRRPPLPGKPESLQDPKKSLRDLIWRRYKKEYLYTVHNSRIAEHIDTSLLRTSGSFAPHFRFTATIRERLRQIGGLEHRRAANRARG
jgi:uncharacterized protein DUF4276